ncbi:MAG: hypothetical protein BWY31_04235 [Lentisphaerae bacterium ADurb.Bin242]|nr:MAG: hypothetical protein BWY31_04235 [Lentisphaerae bacterium ADurb.Bin242]
MKENPFQQKVVRKKDFEEISHVDFSTKTGRNSVFFQLRVYGETNAETRWKPMQKASIEKPDSSGIKFNRRKTPMTGSRG